MLGLPQVGTAAPTSAAPENAGPPPAFSHVCATSFGPLRWLWRDENTFGSLDETYLFKEADCLGGASRDGGAVAWARANADCRAMGMRLCTQRELEGKVTRGTGCSRDPPVKILQNTLLVRSNALHCTATAFDPHSR